MIELTLQHSHSHNHQAAQHKHEDESYSQDSNQSLNTLPCHPHRAAAKFDFSAIQQQIKIIRRKKQQAKQLARLAKKVEKSKNQVYEADIIEEELQQSLDLVPGFISLALKQRIKFIEDKVYISAQNEGFGELVSRIKQEAISNEALGNELNLMMSEIQIGIQNDIDEGAYQVHNVEHKKKIIPIEPQPAHRVKLKNMLIKSKIMDLKEEFNKSQVISQNLITSSLDSSRLGNQYSRAKVQKFVNRKQGQIWGDQFHLLSQGTKKAQQFIKKVQQQQKKTRVEKTKKSHQMKSLQVKSAMQHKQFEQQMKKQRHQSLKKRYQQGRMQKLSQKQKQEQRQKQYINFLKEYRGKRPLFKVKEEQFRQNVLQEQQKRRKAQLQQIKLAKRPITLEQLEQHKKQYQKLKDQKQLQHNQERKLRRRQVQEIPKKEYYRGKFHSIIIEEKQQLKNVVDPQIARQALTKKQRQFGQFVRKKYAPMISQAKKKQLQELMKVIDSQKSKKGLTQEEYKQLGNKYLKQLKAMMEQLRAKGLIKQRVPLPQVPKKKNYLEEMRQKFNFSTIDYSSQVDSNAGWVAGRAYKHEKDAKHKEKLLQFRSQEEFDFQHYMKELQSIHQDYIKSAEAKISLINKLEGRKNLKSQRAISEENSSVKQ